MKLKLCRPTFFNLLFKGAAIWKWFETFMQNTLQNPKKMRSTDVAVGYLKSRTASIILVVICRHMGEII